MTSAALQRSDKFRIGRVLGESFSVIGRNFFLCLGLGMVFYAVPLFVFSMWFEKSLSLVEHGTLVYSFRKVMLLGLTFVCYVALLSFLQAALTRVAIADLNGKTPSVRDSTRTALAFFLPTVGTTSLFGLAILLGLALLVFPGFILLARWFVAVPVLLQERRGVLGSLARSRDLTKGCRWPIFGVWLAVFLATLAINFSLKNLIFTFGIPAGLFFNAVLVTVEFLVGTMIPAVTYVELCRIKEGASVDELAEIFS